MDNNKANEKKNDKEDFNLNANLYADIDFKKNEIINSNIVKQIIIHLQTIRNYLNLSFFFHSKIKLKGLILGFLLIILIIIKIIITIITK